jgi:hypothetical protein
MLTPALIIAFIFPPGLAMPRDWDLFSFPAIPQAAGFLHDSRQPGTAAGYVPISVLAIL